MTPPLTTPVGIDPLPFSLDFDTPVFTIGSCFADEMGHRLAAEGFRICPNPFGTLYNPASIALALDRIVDKRPIVEADLVMHDGLCHSWHHHGRFSRPSARETLDLCNGVILTAHDFLSDARLLAVTFGTAWVYECDEAHGIVANCHKLPPQRFTRRRMPVDEIVAQWEPLLQKLAAFNPGLQVMFTVSPIRHLADGAHGNQLSKSTLLLATDPLAALPKTSYFPAYEIVMDELRDYRFYAADMTHPSPMAADIVYDRFRQACMTPAVVQQAHNNAKQALRQQHIPLH